MTEKVNCVTADCNAQILVSTAKLNSGFCMPCVQRKERQERKKYIEKNRRDIDPYENVNKSTEIIKLFHLKRKHDPLIRYLPFSGKIEEVYKKLKRDEQEQLIEFSLENAQSGSLEYIESICLELAAFCSADLGLVHDFMLSKGVYYPGFIFKDASVEIVSKLFSKLEDASKLQDVNGILVALAWSGSKEVVAKFSEWKTNKPVWAKPLYIEPYDYSKVAGWELSKENTRNNLYFDTCYSLVQNKEKSVNSDFSACTKSESKCGWCNRQITNLFEFDLTNPVLNFLGLTGKKLNIATCDVCSAISDISYMDIDTEGNATWSKYNVAPENICKEDWDFLEENCLLISSFSRPVYFAAIDYLPTNYSQIGGIPTWVQDFDFPDCPSCNSTMRFIAQLDKGDFEEYGEGIYYSYICCDCRITACNYQQT